MRNARNYAKDLDFLKSLWTSVEEAKLKPNLLVLRVLCFVQLD